MLGTSTADSAMDDEVEVILNMPPTNPQADSQIGEPHQHDHVLEEMEGKEKLSDEVKISQQQLQQKLEDAICKGLEGITTIRYGAQACEYHQETLQERELMRSEILKEVTDTVNTNNDKVVGMMQTTHRKRRNQRQKICMN